MWSVITLTVEYSVQLVLQETNNNILYKEKKRNIFQLVMTTSKIKKYTTVSSWKLKKGSVENSQRNILLFLAFTLSTLNTRISYPERLGSAGSESRNWNWQALILKILMLYTTYLCYKIYRNRQLIRRNIKITFRMMKSLRTETLATKKQHESDRKRTPRKLFWNWSAFLDCWSGLLLRCRTSPGWPSLIPTQQAIRKHLLYQHFPSDQTSQLILYCKYSVTGQNRSARSPSSKYGVNMSVFSATRRPKGTNLGDPEQDNLTGARVH